MDTDIFTVSVINKYDNGLVSALTSYTHYIFEKVDNDMFFTTYIENELLLKSDKFERSKDITFDKLNGLWPERANHEFCVPTMCWFVADGVTVEVQNAEEPILGVCTLVIGSKNYLSFPLSLNKSVTNYKLKDDCNILLPQNQNFGFRLALDVNYQGFVTIKLNGIMVRTVC